MNNWLRNDRLVEQYSQTKKFGPRTISIRSSLVKNITLVGDPIYSQMELGTMPFEPNTWWDIVTTTNSNVVLASVYTAGGEFGNGTDYYLNINTKKLLKLSYDTGLDNYTFSDYNWHDGKIQLSYEEDKTGPISEEYGMPYKYKGISINGELRYKEKETKVYEECADCLGPMTFGGGQKLLGVDEGLTKIYFNDGYKNFYYDIVKDELKEVTKLPELVKPLPENTKELLESNYSFSTYKVNGYYINEKMGYRIKIPDGWTVKEFGDARAWNFTPSFVGFCGTTRETGCGPGGPIFAIQVSDTTLESVIVEKGSQFGNERFEKRERIKFGDFDALLVTVTTSAAGISSNWKDESVLLQKDGKVYILGNDDFYKTFEFIN